MRVVAIVQGRVLRFCRGSWRFQILLLFSTTLTCNAVGFFDQYFHAMFIGFFLIGLVMIWTKTCILRLSNANESAMREACMEDWGQGKTAKKALPQLVQNGTCNNLAKSCEHLMMSPVSRTGCSTDSSVIGRLAVQIW